MAQQVLLDELQPTEILGVHLQPFERGDFVELVQHVAAERVLDPALNEGDRNQPLTASDGHDLVEGVRRIDDRLAWIELEFQFGVAEPQVQLATVIILRIVEEDRAGEIAAECRSGSWMKAEVCVRPYFIPGLYRVIIGGAKATGKAKSMNSAVRINAPPSSCELFWYAAGRAAARSAWRGCAGW